MSGVAAGCRRPLRRRRSASTAAPAPKRCWPTAPTSSSTTSPTIAGGAGRSSDVVDPGHPSDRLLAPLPDRAVAARRARVRARRPRPDRDALRRRQRLPRDAGQPGGGPRRAQPRHVPQRLPRDVAIQHAEEAFGFAKTGQTIVNVPDAKLMKLYVDDEPLLLAGADLEDYERALDFRNGVLTRDLVWRTPAGKRVRVRSQRMVSLAHRHLAVMTFEITLLDGARTGRRVVAAHEPPGRRGRVPRPRRGARRGDRPAQGAAVQRPGARAAAAARARRRDHPRLPVRQQRHDAGVRHRHMIDTACRRRGRRPRSAPDLAKTVFSVRRTAGEPIRITKLVAYHSSTGVPAEELADRCHAHARAGRDRRHRHAARRAAGMARRLLGRRPTSSCGRRQGPAGDPLEPLPAGPGSARTHEQGIAAKGVTGGGYDGHYFWDTEVYVVPFLAYTDPDAARKLLRFRWRDARGGTPTGRRDEPGRRAVPVAHDQRRGGVGLLRRGHGAVPHQRRRRVRDRPLRRGHRRRRLPRPRGRRDAGRDRPAVGRPRLLRAATARRRSTSTASPVPTSTRPSSTTTCTRT